MATSLPSSPLPSSITVRGNDGMVILERPACIINQRKS